MNISLPSELEKMVFEKVRQGFYSSSSEVIREALRMFFEKDIIQKQRLSALNTDIQKGLDSVEQNRLVDGPETMEDILNRYQK